MPEEFSNTATVDVVIPTNRAGEFLGAALQSVLGQTHRDWRVTVVDNNSPDPQALAAAVLGALDTAAASSETRSRVTISRESTPGVSAARNHGIARGTAEYVAFLDDDDTWQPGYLSHALAALTDCPSAVGAYTAGWMVNEDGTPIIGWRAEAGLRDRMLSGEAPLPRIMALVVRRAVGDAAGWFDESYTVAEDNEFMMRLLLHGEFAAVPTPLVAYRRHGSNVTGSSGARERMRDSTERYLVERLAAARSSGDTALSGRLAQNLRATRREEARREFRETVNALLRRHSLRGALRSAAWGLSRAPISFLASGTADLARRHLGAARGV
ncbi:glycosyltransferase family 2 protein [Gryllotalpicola ginsengisoli]|uniref:glycosyltransferase family 2 protein n=1 Tax=Gryllotalpicola ginsengisoli TaxID=444608 RepID=UPI0003B439A5|nr:glycosyltransferase [Gryllotalpicola ginsengisoli]